MNSSSLSYSISNRSKPLRASVTSLSDHYTKRGHLEQYRNNNPNDDKGIWSSIKMRIKRSIYFETIYLIGNGRRYKCLPQGTTLYHVTREFGSAVTKTELGKLLTSLVRAQSTDESLKVNVIIPYYPFLKPIYKPISYAQLNIRIQNGQGEWRVAKFGVYRSWIKILNNEEIINSSPRKSTNLKNFISVFMISPSTNMRPYKLAFKVNNKSSIYTSKSTLPLELNALYFSKAAAEFIIYRNTVVDTSLFAKTESRGVDIVHVHGSLNAMTIEFLGIFNKGYKFGRNPPSMIYTFYNNFEEQLFSFGLDKVNRFMDVKKFKEKHSKYFYLNRLYASSLGIGKSQVSTFISKEVAQEMVEGSLEFHMKDLVMPILTKKAIDGYWIGISKGFDLTIINPFEDMLLINSNSNFPDNIHTFDINLFYLEMREFINFSFPQFNSSSFEFNSSSLSQFNLSSSSPFFSQIDSSQLLISTAKTKAKNFLVGEGLLENRDLENPLVLFTGYSKFIIKRFEFFDRITNILGNLNAKFVIISKENILKDKRKEYDEDYDDNDVNIKKLEEKYPNVLLKSGMGNVENATNTNNTNDAGNIITVDDDVIDNDVTDKKQIVIGGGDVDDIDDKKQIEEIPMTTDEQKYVEKRQMTIPMGIEEQKQEVTLMITDEQKHTETTLQISIDDLEVTSISTEDQKLIETTQTNFDDQKLMETLQTSIDVTLISTGTDDISQLEVTPASAEHVETSIDDQRLIETMQTSTEDINQLDVTPTSAVDEHIETTTQMSTDDQKLIETMQTKTNNISQLEETETPTSTEDPELLETETPVSIDYKKHLESLEHSLQKGFNSYLFEFDPNDLDKTISSLTNEFKLAIKDWKRMDTFVKELFMRRLIKEALKFDWNSPGGGVEQYKKVYKLAMMQTSDILEEDLW
ncbi:3908_t:CDS:2 [Diversispora eburnea]|uniref:3908_t:CDS:1 n=1 Tax=Diversispora eburnea TaxID=1213867 RepID=A0A9N9F2D4_9GLOM|nr:3908_t:CDS:2 [Diversispora eburnea]